MSNKLIYLLGFSVLISFMTIQAQTINLHEKRTIQTSTICSKTIINNTATAAVEVTTHRVIPRFASTTFNTNCQSLKAKQGLGNFFITRGGHSVNYVYNPNGTVVIRFTGRITRGGQIACTGCPGSSGLASSFGLRNPIPEFLDCDGAGTCLCFPCPGSNPLTPTIRTPVTTPALPVTNSRP